MPKYNVVITETESQVYRVEVEAESSAVAEDRAQDVLIDSDDKLEEYLDYETSEIIFEVTQCG